jgi:hypothetical protein
VINAGGDAVVGWIVTDVGAHGIYPRRDGRVMFVSNRGRDSPRTPDHRGPGRDR